MLPSSPVGPWVGKPAVMKLFIYNLRVAVSQRSLRGKALTGGVHYGKFIIHRAISLAHRFLLNGGQRRDLEVLLCVGTHSF